MADLDFTTWLQAYRNEADMLQFDDAIAREFMRRAEEGENPLALLQEYLKALKEFVDSETLR